MNTRTSYLLAFLLAFVFTGSNAQSRAQQEADELFNKFAYAKAIKRYEEQVISGKNLNHAYQRLAECYLLLRDFEKSLPYFKRFIENSDTPSNFYFKYAMALRSSGDDKGALVWLKKYKKLHKNDKRVKQFLRDGNLASIVFNSRERYEVEPVHFNTKYSEFGSFAHNGQLYFSSSRKSENDNDVYDWNNEGWLDIYYVPENNTRAKPKRMKGEINSKFHESSLVFSTDYKNDTIAYFTRNNYFKKKESFYTVEKEDKVYENLSNLKIFRADKVDGQWKVTRNMKMNADHYSSGHPTVNNNRTLLFFASDKPGGYGGSDIYYAEIHPRGGIGQPINAGPIVNTSGNELFPFVNNEGQLFFSSDGHVGFGQLDVFATVANSIGQIKEVVNLGTPLNSAKDDFAYYAHENGVDGYVSSNRNGGKGSDDIYKFSFVPSLQVEGIVTDAVNLQVLDSVEVAVYDQSTQELVAKTYTDKNGYYQMFINRKKNYRIDAIRSTHPHKSVYFDTRTIARTEKTIRQDIQLEPVMDLKVLAGLNKIYFDYNQSNIRPDAAKELDKVVTLMMETYPEMIIKLESHTDPVGSHAYNDELSERRAKSTYEYLIARGVPKSRVLSYKGYGKRKPVNDCTSKEDCSPEDLELNRRAEFPIIQIQAKTVVQNR